MKTKNDFNNSFEINDSKNYLLKKVKKGERVSSITNRSLNKTQREYYVNTINSNYNNTSFNNISLNTSQNIHK